MIFTLSILCSPLDPTAYSAWQFANALVTSDHRLAQVFFQGDGIYHGRPCPQAEYDLNAYWQKLAQDYKIPLTLCSNASHKRGICRENISSSFSLGGIASLIEACTVDHKVLRFG